MWIEGETADHEHVEAHALHRFLGGFLHLLWTDGAVFGTDIGLLNHLFRWPVPAELRRSKLECVQKGGKAAFDLGKGFIQGKLLAQMGFPFEPHILGRILFWRIGSNRMQVTFQSASLKSAFSCARNFCISSHGGSWLHPRARLTACPDRAFDTIGDTPRY